MINNVVLSVSIKSVQTAPVEGKKYNRAVGNLQVLALEENSEVRFNAFGQTADTICANLGKTGLITGNLVTHQGRPFVEVENFMPLETQVVIEQVENFMPLETQVVIEQVEEELEEIPF